MESNNDEKGSNKNKKRKFIGWYIIFGVAIFMILYYLVFINGIIAK
jgi:hypothetical protein